MIDIDFELPISVTLERVTTVGSDGSLGPTEKLYVASCPVLDYTTSGETEQEARDMMLDVFQFDLHQHKAKGTLEEYMTSVENRLGMGMK